MDGQSLRSYRCMPRRKLQDGALALAAVQPSDIESIRQWRNAQMSVLRQSEVITPDQQREYYDTYVWPEMDVPRPRNILLIYLENEVAIGYGALVHIAWEHRRAEVSFLLNPLLAGRKGDYTRYFAPFLKLMKTLAFEDLGLERIFTETYATRTHHIAVLEAAGFRREGTLRHHVIIDGQPVDSIVHGCISSYER